MREPLSHRCRGRWRGILAALGVDSVFLTGKHTACPLCRAGRDRWRFSDREGSGSWICSVCGSGGGIDLVMRLRSVEFKDAAKLIEEVIGRAEIEPPRPKVDPLRARLAMKRLWLAGAPLRPGGIVDRYLAGRGIPARPDHTALREIADRDLLMIAKVISPDGRAVNVHRTFLAEPGVKAAMAQPRKMLPGQTPLGSAARLMPPGESLGIAEGIETALSAAAIFAVPVWAAFNANNLAAFKPPDGVRRLLIFGDNDENHHGQWAAESAARAAHRAGLAIEVHVPPEPGTDWNDVHRKRREAA